MIHQFYCMISYVLLCIMFVTKQNGEILKLIDKKNAKMLLYFANETSRQ